VKRLPFILVLAATVRADSLPDILSRMDRASKVFKSLSADVHQVVYTDVLSEKDEDPGTYTMMKSGKDKVVFLAEFSGPDARKISITGDKVQIYHPKANSVEIYDAKKYTKSIDQYLFVGFGMSSAELLKTYEVTLGGPDTIGGVKTTRIELAPKSAEAKKLFNKIQVWFPDGKPNPIQEKMITGKESKDYKLFEFSNEVVKTTSDPPLPASDFDLNLPPGVKKIVGK